MLKWHLIYIILYALHAYVILSLLTEEDLNAYDMMKNHTNRVHLSTND